MMSSMAFGPHGTCSSGVAVGACTVVAMVRWQAQPDGGMDKAEVGKL
jgi:hypothetical protein